MLLVYMKWMRNVLEWLLRCNRKQTHMFQALKMKHQVWRELQQRQPILIVLVWFATLVVLVWCCCRANTSAPASHVQSISGPALSAVLWRMMRSRSSSYEKCSNNSSDENLLFLMCLIRVCVFSFFFPVQVCWSLGLLSFLVCCSMVVFISISYFCFPIFLGICHVLFHHFLFWSSWSPLDGIRFHWTMVSHRPWST